MALLGIREKWLVQLEVLRRASPDRRSFEAIKGLTYHKATSSINYQRRDYVTQPIPEKMRFTENGLVQAFNEEAKP
jgi:hypothetical protein